MDNGQRGMGMGDRRELDRGEIEGLGVLPLALDPGRVRIYRLGCGGTGGAFRKLVLRLSGGRAVALGNHVFLPARCEGDLAALAHELTHCAQYQAWGRWRYFTRGAAVQLRDLLHRRLGWGASPYAYRLEDGKPFEAYGMEQQGQIVEDSVRTSSRARYSAPSA
ncbi:MAG: DUF4157 domain-containing protein [Gemmatimonadales bacterium]|nr:DUF4157 domain-containing protein [Gemmatimonadales bacterium]